MTDSPKYSCIEMLDAFADFEENKISEEVISTGFLQLDNLLDGGLPEIGLHILGACSSIGKTTFALQAAESIAERVPVLVVSLETKQKPLLAKSISRQTYLLAKDERLAKSMSSLIRRETRDKFTFEEQQLIKRAVEESKKRFSNINIATESYTIKEIETTIQKYREVTGKNPFIVLDYIQKVRVPDSVDTNDKKKIDYIMDRLTEMRDKLGVSILAISAFNRENYKEEATFKSFIGSSRVEYDADTVMALQLKDVGKARFDEDKAKSKHIREVELKILKQKTGKLGKIPFLYRPAFNYFYEDKGLRIVTDNNVDNLRDNPSTTNTTEESWTMKTV